MRSYTHVFFDLDHTLWDCDANSAEVLRELHDEFSLAGFNIPLQQKYFDDFDKVNDFLWRRFESGIIEKNELVDQRFVMLFEGCQVGDHDLAITLSREYAKRSRCKKYLVDGAIQVLQYLKSKRYNLFILSNGDEEDQLIKIESSGLREYFSDIFTSSRMNRRKPDKQLFEAVLAITHGKLSQSVMIGDGLHTDVAGANSAGMDCIFLNRKGVRHHEQVTHEIRNLAEILDIL